MGQKWTKEQRENFKKTMQAKRDEAAAAKVFARGSNGAGGSRPRMVVATLTVNGCKITIEEA